MSRRGPDIEVKLGCCMRSATLTILTIGVRMQIPDAMVSALGSMRIVLSGSGVYKKLRRCRLSMHGEDGFGGVGCCPERGPHKSLPSSTKVLQPWRARLLSKQHSQLGCASDWAFESHRTSEDVQSYVEYYRIYIFMPGRAIMSRTPVPRLPDKISGMYSTYGT